MLEVFDLIAVVVSWVLLTTGAFFSVAGGIGIVRLPDFYTRLHGGGMTDTLGAGLILAGLMVQGLGLIAQGGTPLVTVKLLMILFFLLVTSPTSCHALAQSALTTGLHPQSDREQPQGASQDQGR